MQQCHQCGNHYDECFEVIMLGERYIFDSFECAIQKLAPTCPQCGCRIIGHGVEENRTIYCCAHCAGAMGATAVRDRAGR